MDNFYPLSYFISLQFLVLVTPSSFLKQYVIWKCKHDQDR